MVVNITADVVLKL